MSFPGFVATPDEFQVTNATAQTPDATATELWASPYSPVPAASCSRYRATIKGIKSDGTARATYTREWTEYRADSGDVVVTSQATPSPDYESDATWGGPTITADTTNQRSKLAVVGKASTTINWSARVEQI